MPSALIIDDNYYNRDIFRITLEHIGYQVAESSDGIKGLAEFNRNHYDLVILDLRMPTMTGTEVLQIMRADARGKQAQVIVVTANPHMATDDVHEQADYVLQKPIDVALFSALARRCMTQLSLNNDTIASEVKAQ
jgi:CheY-like chemotaxis protein